MTPNDSPQPAPVTCWKCGNGHTPLYCLACADVELRKQSTPQPAPSLIIPPTSESVKQDVAKWLAAQPAPAAATQWPTLPLDRLRLSLSNRGSVARNSGFTSMADDYAQQLAALQSLERENAALRSSATQLRIDADTLRDDRDAWQAKAEAMSATVKELRGALEKIRGTPGKAETDAVTLWEAQDIADAALAKGAK
jgi:hypothetical protein